MLLHNSYVAKNCYITTYVANFFCKAAIAYVANCYLSF